MSLVGDGVANRGYERIPTYFSTADGGWNAGRTISWSVWLKPASVAEMYFLSFADTGAGTRYYAMWGDAQTDVVAKAFRRNVSSAISSGIVLPQDVWSHVAVVLKPNFGRCWVDSVADTENITSLSGHDCDVTTYGFLRFGGGNFGAMDAKMGDLATWIDYELTQADVDTIFAGRPQDIATQPTMRRDLVDNFTTGAGELGSGGTEIDPRWDAIGTNVWDANDNPPSLVAGPDTPTLTLGTVGQTTADFTTSAFSGGTAPHKSTSWEVATDAGFSTIVASSINDTSALTAWTAGTGTPASNNPLAAGTEHWARARHRGDDDAESSNSNVVNFTTTSATIGFTNFTDGDGNLFTGTLHYEWHNDADVSGTAGLGNLSATPARGSVTMTDGAATIPVSAGDGYLRVGFFDGTKYQEGGDRATAS